MLKAFKCFAVANELAFCRVYQLLCSLNTADLLYTVRPEAQRSQLSKTIPAW